MLTDTIASSVRAIKNKRRAQENKLASDAYLSAMQRLEQACETASEFIQSAQSIQAAALSDLAPLKNSTQQDLFNSISVCGNAIEEQSLSKETVQVFLSALTTAKSELSTFWKENAAAYSDGARGYLSLISELTDDPSKSNALVKRISDALNSVPSASDVKKFTDNVQAANDIISRYELKPEIEIFLKKVAAHRANLSDITPDILSWLQQKNLTQRLKINFFH